MKTKKVNVEIEIPENMEISQWMTIKDHITISLRKRKPKELKLREVIGATEILPGQWWSNGQSTGMLYNEYSFPLGISNATTVWELVDEC